MIQHDVDQGTAEWHAHRAHYFNASDAPAMLGISPYKTRSALIAERATGITDDIDPNTQRIFDRGHKFEALARPLAEAHINEDLYPVTGTEGKLSASFDGLTIDENIAFEHKTLNSSLRGISKAEDLPEHYRAQMEQQLLISGAEKCLFMATKWDDNDQLLEQMQVWYTPDLDLRNSLIKGWLQFEQDVTDYRATTVKEPPKPAPIIGLPALIVQIKGEITLSNLPDFKAAAEQFIQDINTDLHTDEDFAQAEATVKFCDKAEKELEHAKRNALAQTNSIEECLRTIDHIRDQLRAKRLTLDKLVKTQKEVIKHTMVNTVRTAYSDFCDAHRDYLHLMPSDNFAGVIKNKRTLTSIQDALDTELARLKIEAHTIIDDITLKISWFNDNCKDYLFLFSDIKDLVTASETVFKFTAEKRIYDYQQQQAKEQEEKERKHLALLAEQEEKERKRLALLAEQEAAQASVKLTEAVDIAPEATRQHDTAVIKTDEPSQVVSLHTAQADTVKYQPKRPTDADIIDCVSSHFNVDFNTALKWLSQITMAA
jgi:putative phage-type endonuclease